MAFRKIDAPSIKELFLSQMEEMILSGELKPGDKLPPERELADTMGISKTVVHEGSGSFQDGAFSTCCPGKASM